MWTFVILVEYQRWILPYEVGHALKICMAALGRWASECWCCDTWVSLTAKCQELPCPHVHMIISIPSPWALTRSLKAVCDTGSVLAVSSGFPVLVPPNFLWVPAAPTQPCPSSKEAPQPPWPQRRLYQTRFLCFSRRTGPEIPHYLKKEWVKHKLTVIPIIYPAAFN